MNATFKIKRNDGLLLFFCLSYILFGLASTLIDYIVPIHWLRAAIAGMGIAIEAILFAKDSMNHQSSVFYILMIGMMLTAVFRSAWGINSTLMYAFAMGLCVMIPHFFRLTKMIVPVILAGTAFYAVCTIFLYFNRNIYMHYVVDLFPDTKAALVRMYNNGCMAGLTNHYSTNGMFLSVGMLIAYCWWREHRKKTVSTLMLLLFIIALLLTGKRAHTIFSIAAVFVIYWCSLKDRNAILRVLKLVLLFLVVLAVGVAVFMYVPALARFIYRFIETTQNNDDVSMGRFGLWTLALQTFLQNPVFGIGWYNYYGDVSNLMGKSKLYAVHNVYFQLLCETGIVGFVIYMLWFFGLYILTVREYRRTVRANIGGNYYLRISLAIQTFFLLYCLTGNPLYDRQMYFPYFFACGIALHHITHKRAVTSMPNYNSEVKRR